MTLVQPAQLEPQAQQVQPALKLTFTVSATAPSSPVEGDAWFNSTDGRMYVYYDGYWVESNSAPQGPTGATGPTGADGPTGPTGATGEVVNYIHPYFI